MTDSTGPYIVLYRWRVDPVMEAAFIRAWSTITERLRDDHASLGSRLHRGADGLWYGYAQWPSEDARRAAFASEVDPAASAQMRGSTVESFPEVVLDLVADFLTPLN